MKYYIPDYDETAENAEELPPTITLGYPYGADEFAEEAADYIHSNRDGWEASWPMLIVVIDDAGREHRFSVQRESVPQFIAYELEAA